MKTTSLFGLLLLAITSLAWSAPGPSRLYADYFGGKIARVSADGAVDWEFPAKKPGNCIQLPNGNVLFCDIEGPKEVTPEKTIVWQYRPKAPGLCHFFELLPNGDVLIAETMLSRLVEIGRDGRVKKEIPVPSNPAKINSHQFRGVRKTADGHYWLCMMEESKIVELSSEGAVLREFPMPGHPCEALRLPDGHLLVTMYGPARVAEFDEQLRVVWEIAQNELPGNPLRIPFGVERLPNGNTLVCNSLHSFMGKQPQAFEVTPDKRVVWELTDHARFKNVSYIHTVTAPQTP